MSAAGAVVASRKPKAPPSKREGRLAVYETAGPKQLAEQPADPKIMATRPTPQWDVLRQHMEGRLNMLRAWRFTWADHWQLLETYILPRRGIFINPAMPTPNSMIRGVPINSMIVDPTGTQAMRICAAGLMSGLMSPGRPWFKLKPAMGERENADADAAEWFEQVEDLMYQVMAGSNFYDAGAQMFEDLTTFGTGPQIIYEDEKDVIRCYTPCPGEYFLAVGPNGRVNGFYRQFVQTIAQIVEFFGVENCPPDVQEMWRTKGSSLEVERLVAHCIEPNFPIERFGDQTVGVIKGDFTWREYYWVWGYASGQPLSERGFKDAPFVCPRWATTSNDAYGRSVGMDVLPDIMQLQQETRRKAEAIEKMVRPPLLASMELKNEPSSILPGHLTYVSQLGPEKGMRPIYTVNPEIKEMMEDLREVQARIKTGFFNDLFLMMAESTKDMTAYEVAQRQQEKLQVLGPVVERFQNEFASPAIKRVFRIMERKKLLPPLPKSLWGVPIGIEYISMMALAQRASSTAALERYAQIAGNLGAVYPEAKASLDPIGFMQEYGKDLSVSARVKRTPEQVKAIIQQQAQAAAQQQAGNEAMAAVQGAQTLSQTNLGNGQNALGMMLGTGSGTNQ